MKEAVPGTRSGVKNAAHRLWLFTTQDNFKAGTKNCGWEEFPHTDLALMVALSSVDDGMYPTVRKLADHEDTGEEMFADALLARAVEDLDRVDGEGGGSSSSSGAQGVSALDEEADEAGDGAGETDDELDDSEDAEDLLSCTDEAAAEVERRLLEGARLSARKGDWHELMDTLQLHLCVRAVACALLDCG
jgi:hypothetical protein